MLFAVAYRKEGSEHLLPGALFLKEDPSGGYTKDGDARTATKQFHACLAWSLAVRYQEPPAGYLPAEVVGLTEQKTWVEVPVGQLPDAGRSES